MKLYNMDAFDDDSSSDDMFGDTNVNRPNKHAKNREDLSDPKKDDSKETSSNTRDNRYQSVVRLPKVAVKEKIIICIENSPDKGLGYSFTDLDKNSKELPTFAVRNEAIKMFMTNKLAVAEDTEFAIVSLEPGKLNILSFFSSDLNELMKALMEYKFVLNDESDILNVLPIFNDLQKFFQIPLSSNGNIIPPNHIVRVIFIYGDSFRTPQVNTNDPSYTTLMKSPCFFFDVLYLHEKQSDFNSVENIYKELRKMAKPSSYVLECSRNVTKVFNSSMKLLAHPNQRVAEDVWNF